MEDSLVWMNDDYNKFCISRIKDVSPVYNVEVKSADIPVLWNTIFHEGLRDIPSFNHMLCNVKGMLYSFSFLINDTGEKYEVIANKHYWETKNSEEPAWFVVLYPLNAVGNKCSKIILPVYMILGEFRYRTSVGYHNMNKPDRARWFATFTAEDLTRHILQSLEMWYTYQQLLSDEAKRKIFKINKSTIKINPKNMQQHISLHTEAKNVLSDTVSDDVLDGRYPFYIERNRQIKSEETWIKTKKPELRVVLSEDEQQYLRQRHPSASISNIAKLFTEDHNLSPDLVIQSPDKSCIFRVIVPSDYKERAKQGLGVAFLLYPCTYGSGIDLIIPVMISPKGYIYADNDLGQLNMDNSTKSAFSKRGKVSKMKWVNDIMLFCMDLWYHVQIEMESTDNEFMEKSQNESEM